MKKLILLPFVLSSIVLLAYTGTENTRNAIGGEERADFGQHSKSSDFESPCELISLEEVKKRCNLDASVEISVEDKVYTYPTCTFNWKDGKLTKLMDIGDKATWSAKRAQLTFFFNTYLFHVHVRASNDDAVNKKDAIEIAGDIIAKLN